MALTLDDIEPLFAAKGDRMYAGEPVTQLQHALQSAQLAEQSGADAALVVAALLHDLGHMVNDQGETPTLRGIDDRHEYVALPFLRGLFDDAVLQPIRLHVDAKRYLCARKATERSTALNTGPTCRPTRSAVSSCRAAFLPTPKRSGSFHNRTPLAPSACGCGTTRRRSRTPRRLRSATIWHSPRRSRCGDKLRVSRCADASQGMSMRTIWKLAIACAVVASACTKSPEPAHESARGRRRKAGVDRMGEHEDHGRCRLGIRNRQGRTKSRSSCSGPPRGVRRAITSSRRSSRAMNSSRSRDRSCRSTSMETRRAVRRSASALTSAAIRRWCC